jgi:predicted transposase YdaD
MGLRYKEDQVDAIIEGVSAMLFGIRGIEESTVYQGILRRGEAEGRAEGRAEGEAEGIREALLIQGRKKLGAPDEKMSARLAEIHDLDGLKLLLERILDVSSWDELLPPADPSA